MALTLDMKVVVVAEEELRKIIREEVTRAMASSNTPYLPPTVLPYVGETPQIWSGTTASGPPDANQIVTNDNIEDPNVAIAHSQATTAWK